MAVKKGITSPSRGLSQHRSHTQDVRRGKKKKCLSCSLPRYSLFSTSGFKQPTRGSSPQPPTEPSPSAPESVSPLFDETQNYSSPCKVTSSQHAKCRWGEKERRERRTAERMREERYSTHRRPSGEKHAQLGALTGSQLRRLASKKQETLGGGVKASEEEMVLILPMMGASRKMSDRRLFTGSYGESSRKSLPVRRTDRCYR